MSIAPCSGSFRQAKCVSHSGPGSFHRLQRLCGASARAYHLPDRNDRRCAVLRLEVTHTRSLPFYPVDKLPPPSKALPYQKAAITGAPSSYGNGRPFLDFQKEIVDGGGRVPTGFIRDGETAANIIRAPGAPRPPDSERGHFHEMAHRNSGLYLEGEVDFLSRASPSFKPCRATSSMRRLDAGTVPVMPAPVWIHAFRSILSPQR